MVRVHRYGGGPASLDHSLTIARSGSIRLLGHDALWCTRTRSSVPYTHPVDTRGTLSAQALAEIRTLTEAPARSLRRMLRSPTASPPRSRSPVCPPSWWTASARSPGPSGASWISTATWRGSSAPPPPVSSKQRLPEESFGDFRLAAGFPADEHVVAALDGHAAAMHPAPGIAHVDRAARTLPSPTTVPSPPSSFMDTTSFRVRHAGAPRNPGGLRGAAFANVRPSQGSAQKSPPWAPALGMATVSAFSSMLRRKCTSSCTRWARTAGSASARKLGESAP